MFRQIAFKPSFMSNTELYKYSHVTICLQSTLWFTLPDTTVLIICCIFSVYNMYTFCIMSVVLESVMAGRKLCVLTYLANKSDSDVISGSFGYQAPLVLSGGRGRPHYCVTREQLSFLRSCGFTAPQMADILHVSVRTVRRRLR